jgi:hypothetical protein
MDDVKVTTANGNVIVASTKKNYGVDLYIGNFQNNRYRYKSKKWLKNIELIDITAVKKIDYSKPDNASKYYLIVAGKERSAHRHLVLYSYEITVNRTLFYKGKIKLKREEAEKLLLASEAGWEHGSINPAYFENRSGFVITGKGVGREIRNKEGKWQKTRKGLKILYGYVMDDGRPTLLSSNLSGARESEAASMLDVSHNLRSGVVTAEKSRDDYLQLIFWKYKDNYKDFRWDNY